VLTDGPLGQLGNSALHLAALGAHLDVVQLLIEQRADVNGINDEGNTALILSTICMSESAADCAKLLIESKADPEIENLPSENGGGGGCRALHYACGEGNMPIVKYLVEGARVELRAVSKDVLTPLLCAMINNRSEVASFLIRSDPGCAFEPPAPFEAPPCASPTANQPLPSLQQHARTQAPACWEAWRRLPGTRKRAAHTHALTSALSVA